jgi:TRAP-type C4-dicarboxylate transport system substrate-binding protein
MKKRSFLAALSVMSLLAFKPIQAQAETIEITFSTYLPPTYAYVWEPIQNFVKAVETESNGRVKFKVFHSAQLYDGYQELSAISRGDVDMVNMTGTYPSGTVPALSIFTLPFMFTSVDHLERALNQGLLDLGIRQELANDHNTVVLGVGPYDPYEFYSKSTPMTSVADIKGKVWATTGAIDARAIQLMGGSPTGMPSSELYLAFDRGVIDATPRPLLTGVGRKLYEVVDYLSLANFGIDTAILAINKEKWESLPKDIQEIISKAAAERDKQQFQMVREFVKTALANFEKNGMTINQIPAAQIDEMKKLTAPAITEWEQKVPNGKEYLELIVKTQK